MRREPRCALCSCVERLTASDVGRALGAGLGRGLVVDSVLLFVHVKAGASAQCEQSG